MDNKDITTCFKDCYNLKDVFNTVASNNLTLSLTNLNVGSAGFKILKTRDDYAIIEVYKDTFDESAASGKFIHPYGSSVGYTLVK